jgi:pimeloyl-ACP methyl ester carboxylesterase
MTTRPTADRLPRFGTCGNGMEYAAWGTGAKALLFIPGGPGSSLPSGLWLRMSRRLFAPYVEAGYTVWHVTRCRGMPPGHTVADMADDCARTVAEELGGRADLVVGESFGGMIAQHLAADHPETVARLALVVTAVELSPWCKDVDTRLLTALQRGDLTAAGATFGEYALPGPRLRPVRRLLAPLFVRTLLPKHASAVGDAVVELHSELGFDGRPALPRIQAPVLMICGDRDRIFPAALATETAGLIPDCDLLWYRGKGHVGAASSGRVPRDVLAWADRR